MLESLVRMAGGSARQLEEQLDYGAGTVQRLFSGKIALKLRHVLLILDVLGIPPSQFFREAFQDEERLRSEPEMAARVLELLERNLSPRSRISRGRRQRAAPPSSPAISDEELERRLRAALDRMGFVPPQGP